jgi:uncharacterized protein DUF5683
MRLPPFAAVVVLALVAVAVPATHRAQDADAVLAYAHDPEGVACAPSRPRGGDVVARFGILGASNAEPGTRTGAFFRSMVLPGYGQFHNGQRVKAGLFLGVEVALLGTALAFHLAGDSILATYARTPSPGADRSPNAQALTAAAGARYAVRDTLLFAASGLWGLNVIDAFLSGSRRPSAASALAAADPAGRVLAPLAAIRPGMAVLGLQGRW